MIKYHKYHALGNDYIVIDPNECELELTPKRIERICNRHFGIGSDGILLGPIMKNNSLSVRIFNPDGSEAEKSGNGIRIFSQYLIDKKLVNTNTFELGTLGGTVRVESLDESGNTIRVAMGKVTFNSQEIPVSGPKREIIDKIITIDENNYKMTCLSIGNPHCVIPMQKISKAKALSLGPIVENHPMFPNRINLQILEVTDRNNIKIEIWERGAGYTLASGSSSSAAASAAYRLGLVDKKIAVHMPGGIIDILIADDMMVYMTGSVNSVCEGVFSNQFADELNKL